MRLIEQLQTSIQQLEAATDKYRFAASRRFDETLTRHLLEEVEAARQRLGAVLDTIKSQSTRRTLEHDALPFWTLKASTLMSTTELAPLIGDDAAAVTSAKAARPLDASGHPIERRARNRRMLDKGH